MAAFVIALLVSAVLAQDPSACLGCIESTLNTTCAPQLGGCALDPVCFPGCLLKVCTLFNALSLHSILLGGADVLFFFLLFFLPLSSLPQRRF